MEKKWRYVVVAVSSAAILASALYVLFGKDFLKNRYVSGDVDGEVLNWNPGEGDLKLKILRDSTVFTTTVAVNPPRTTAYAMHAGRDEDGLEAVTYVRLTGPEDEAWERAFCVGDVVRLTSDEFDVSRAEIGGRLEATYVQKINETLCE